ncbi:hypothetical protein BGS_0011 [Beggiatoa sp. SS]|nr:hypothetical protein BGS_0011 [Beggiatoa sp. SS]
MGSLLGWLTPFSLGLKKNKIIIPIAFVFIKKNFFFDNKFMLSLNKNIEQF